MNVFVRSWMTWSKVKRQMAELGIDLRLLIAKPL